MEDCGKHVSIKNALKVHRQRKHQRAAQGPGLESQTYLSIKKSSLVLMENFTLVSVKNQSEGRQHGFVFIKIKW